MGKKDKKYISRLEVWKEEIKKDRSYAIRQYDKLIVYLSGGGLAITTGITANLINLEKVSTNSVMVLSWILFTVALISNLVSQLTSLKALDLEISRTSKEIRNLRKKNEIESLDRLIRKMTAFNFLTKLFHYLSLISLLAALVLYTIFIVEYV